jgi:hypothetical protein
VTLCALDPEYHVEVDVADSPLFTDLLTHWEGISETVSELQGHMYQEVIELTVTQRHVVTIKAEKIEMKYQAHDTLRDAMTERYDVLPSFTGKSMTAYNKFDVEATQRMYKFDDIGIDDTVTFLDKAWIEESKKRKRFHRTRLFFRLVGAAFREARAS